jgi:hypothetical protein
MRALQDRQRDISSRMEGMRLAREKQEADMERREKLNREQMAKIQAELWNNI